jgi:chromosome segregation ATPase
MEKLKGVNIGHPATVAVFLCAVLALLPALTGCEQWNRMEENQVKLEAMVAANARQLATISSQVHAGDERISGSIQNLDENTQQVAAGVVTVQDEQRQLRNELAGGNQQLTAKITDVRANQDVLDNHVTQVAEVTRGTASDLTALAREHEGLQQAVRTNQQELTGRLGTLADSQQQIHTGIGQLQQADAGLATSLTAMADQQATFQETLVAHRTESGSGLAALSEGQQNLQTGVSALNVTAERTTANLAQMSSSLQATLRDNHGDVKTQIAALSQSQQNEQTALAALNEKADQAAGEFAKATSSLQDNLRVTREVLTGQMAASLQNQQSLQAAAQDLDTRLGTLSTGVGEVATGQTAMHAAVKTNHDAVVAQLGGLSESQTALRDSVNHLNERTEAVAAAENSLQQLLASHSEVVNGQFASFSDWRQMMQDQVDILTATAAQTALDITGVAEHQTALGEVVQRDNAAAHEQMARLADGQQQLQTGLNTVAATTGQTALDVTAVAQQQNTLQETVQQNRAAVSGQMTQLADAQQQLQTGVSAIAATTGQTALDVTAVAQQQKTLQETVQQNHAGVSGQMTQLADAQQQLQTGMGTIAATTGQTARDVTAVAQQQNALRETVQQNHAAVSDRMTQLADAQQQIQSGLDVVTATAGQTALDVLAATGQQDALRQTLQQDNTALSGQMSQLADAQQQMQTGMSTIAATTGQTARDVTAVAQQQNALRETVQQNHAGVSGRMTQLADAQQQMQTGLDVVTATAGQTALDVLAATQQQDALRQALRQDNAALNGQMAALAESQQQVQSGVDTITATTGQNALDSIAMSNGQTRMEQAMQAGREELATRLAALEQEQQSWLQRFDTAQARINTLAEGIGALEQRLAALQGTLQTSIEGLTAGMAAEGDKRLQAEAKAIRDLQAVVESVAQLRQTQASLREQTTQVRQDTPAPSEVVPPAAEQPKPQPASEVKVSDAGTTQPMVDADAK